MMARPAGSCNARGTRGGLVRAKRDGSPAGNRVRRGGPSPAIPCTSRQRRIVLHPETLPVQRYQFTLYVAGDSPRSAQAIRNLRGLGDKRLHGGYDLAVIDVLTDPERAELARILTTPTLV